MKARRLILPQELQSKGSHAIMLRRLISFKASVWLSSMDRAGAQWLNVLKSLSHKLDTSVVSNPHMKLDLCSEWKP